MTMMSRSPRVASRFSICRRRKPGKLPPQQLKQTGSSSISGRMVPKRPPVWLATHNLSDTSIGSSHQPKVVWMWAGRAWQQGLPVVSSFRPARILRYDESSQDDIDCCADGGGSPDDRGPDVRG